MNIQAAAYLPTSADVAELGSEYGYLLQGYLPLRRRIAHYYDQLGIATSPEQILITTGAQQAIALVASCFLQRGDPLLVESPTYFGAIDAFRSLGLRLQSVPVTREGLNLERLLQRLQAGAAEWLYLIPTFHNPTATSLTEEQRLSVVQAAEQWGTTIIEDLTMADLALTDRTPPPLAAYSSGDQIISIGSLSKIIWGGLRVGWVRASAAIIARLTRFKAIQDRGSPTLNQVTATHLFADLQLVVQQRREELQRGLTCMEEHLRQWLPTWQWAHPAGSLFIWAQLPEGDASELAQIAARAGVLVTPGSLLSVDEDHLDYLRLAYVRPLEEITTGLERLRLAWEEYSRKMVRYHLVPPIIV
jgi:DNA-binding transcriptional MocR family regulator